MDICGGEGRYHLLHRGLRGLCFLTVSRWIRVEAWEAGWLDLLLTASSQGFVPSSAQSFEIRGSVV